MIRTIRHLIRSVTDSDDFGNADKSKMEDLLTSMPRYYYIGRSQILMAWAIVETVKKLNRHKEYTTNPPPDISKKDLAKVIAHFIKFDRDPEKYTPKRIVIDGKPITNHELVRRELIDIYRDAINMKPIHESRLDAWLYVADLISEWIDGEGANVPIESIAATIIFYELSLGPKGPSYSAVARLSSVPMEFYKKDYTEIRKQILARFAEEE